MAASRRDIVVGDVVLFDQGDEVPTDGRVSEATSLEVNEAAFIGEFQPARKNAGENQGGTFDSNQLLRSMMVVDGGVLQVEKEGLERICRSHRYSSQMKRRLQRLNPDSRGRRRPLLPTGVAYRLPFLRGKIGCCNISRARSRSRSQRSPWRA